MPSTLSGLLVFVALLVPGFTHYSWRRRMVPLSPDSALVETANLVTVSVIADGVALFVFATGRWIRPSAFFDPSSFLADPSGFVVDNPGLALRTATGLLVVSVGVALLIAVRPRPLAKVADRFAPSILDVPAWYHVFESDVPSTDAGDPCYVHVGCTLGSGAGYISGVLAWYSTDDEGSGDRNLVLAPPFTRETHEGTKIDMENVERVVLSAREISVMEVSFVPDLDWAADTPAS